MELDEAGDLIRYEEHYAFGSTDFQSGPSSAEVSLKRYRYTGKERDAETGFNYHGARYDAPYTTPTPRSRRSLTSCRTEKSP